MCVLGGFSSLIFYHVLGGAHPRNEKPHAGLHRAGALDVLPGLACVLWSPPETSQSCASEKHPGQHLAEPLWLESLLLNLAVADVIFKIKKRKTGREEQLVVSILRELQGNQAAFMHRGCSRLFQVFCHLFTNSAYDGSSWDEIFCSLCHSIKIGTCTIELIQGI